ncbi:T6SS phospholipase effector Tle1-like catalytic domain-containing protein [Pseudomonas putida]
MDQQEGVYDGTRAVILRVGVFFDGTGNNQGNSAQVWGQAKGLGGSSYANACSNVALLHGLYPLGVLAEVAGSVFFKVYIEGVGTQEGGPDSVFAQATGRGQSGVQSRCEEALRKVAGQLRQWLEGPRQQHVERVEFDLFGFSRGAAAARHLANQLSDGAHNLAQVASSWPLRCDLRVNFMGLFDTVAAIIAPLKGNFDAANAQYDGLRLGLAPGIAGRVVQLVAGDERRHNFPLVASADDIVVPGVHSDIGGGYLPCMQEQLLLSKPQSSRVSLRTPIAQTQAFRAVSRLLQSEFSHLPEPRAQVRAWEEPIEGARAKGDDPEKHVYAAVYRQREVLGHLSRVYLSVMRELALGGGVPFAELGGDERHSVALELQGISRKLHDFALGRSLQVGLTLQEQALLEAKYIHTSAHWNTLLGLRNSDLDLLYAHRPEAGGRVVHVNPLV